MSRRKKKKKKKKAEVGGDRWMKNEKKKRMLSHLKSHPRVGHRVARSGPRGVGEAPEEKVLAHESVDVRQGARVLPLWLWLWLHFFFFETSGERTAM